MRNVRRLLKKIKTQLEKSLLSKKRGRPKKKTLRLCHKIGTLLIIVGIAVALSPFVFENSSQLLPKRSNPKPAAKTATDPGPIRIDPALLSFKEPSQPPERIIIPNQKINLAVVEAPVVNGYWELSETSASHGVGSANPGNSGNVVIFAHAREGLFLSLKDVRVNDEVLILTKDHWYRYQVKDIKDVSPDQTEVISPTSDETLTLYTCSGFLDSKRRIVVAKRLS